MPEEPLPIAVLTRDNRFAGSLRDVARELGEVSVAAAGDDLRDLLEASVSAGAVLLADADLIVGRRPNGDVPSVTAAPTIIVYRTAGIELIREGTWAGALGFLSRESAASPRLLEAVRRVRRAEFYLDSEAIRTVLAADGAQRSQTVEELRARYQSLSARERQVFVRLARGLTAAHISQELGISAKTVETHKANLTEKLGAVGAVELFHIARRLGLAPPPIPPEEG